MIQVRSRDRQMVAVFAALIVIGTSAAVGIVLVIAQFAQLNAERAARRGQVNQSIAGQHADLCTAIAAAFPPGGDVQLRLTEMRVGCPLTRPIPIPTPTASSSTAPAGRATGVAAGAAPTSLGTAGSAPALPTRPAPRPSSGPGGPRPSPSSSSPAPAGCLLTVLIPIGGCPK